MKTEWKVPVLEVLNVSQTLKIHDWDPDCPPGEEPGNPGDVLDS
ncbi:paeninodin family lasso peptide [Jeotgalibacillus proteolyticus]